MESGACGKKLKIMTRTASHHNTFLILAKFDLQNKGAFLVIFAWKQITNSTNMRIKRLISAWPPSSSSASTSLTPDSTSPEWRSRRAGSRLSWNVFFYSKNQMQRSWVGDQLACSGQTVKLKANLVRLKFELKLFQTENNLWGGASCGQQPLRSPRHQHHQVGGGDANILDDDDDYHAHGKEC